ncbi:MAG: aryl-sulfate sulfotransferase, partial [Gemmatimonadaceae bacterium]
MKTRRIAAAVIASSALCASCSSKEPVAPPVNGFIIRNDFVSSLNQFSPLTTSIHVETSSPSQLSLRVAGTHGAASDVVKDFPSIATSHDVPVLGLYAGSDNTVQLIFKDASGTELGRKSYTIRTSPLPTNTFPAINIDTRLDGQFADGMTLVSYFGYALNSFPQFPFIFDAFGDIRWYLDFRPSAFVNNLFYDDGVERLRNGNLYFGDISSNAIYEIDAFGRIIDVWSLPGYQFHHNVLEKPNGNFLVTVSKGSATVEDYVIEISRTSKQIVRTWDLRASLQYGRKTLGSDPVDWIHVNAVMYDPVDNTIIISGRTQAVVKLDENNHVVWILGCHKGWGTSGDGVDLTKALLQPLDRNGQPITDAGVLAGDTNHPDFEWNWYQHAPELMPNGHLILFDNGDNRNFGSAGRYSRAVEYEIDPARMTVKQVWTYGKSRGTSTYSRIVSDVDFLGAQNHVIFSPGAVSGAPNYGKVIELDYATQNVVFEATLTPPNTFFGITF